MASRALLKAAGVPHGTRRAAAATAFLKRFGFVLAPSTPLGAELARAGLDSEAPTLRTASLKGASKFLAAWEDGRRLTTQTKAWLARFRCRIKNAEMTLTPSTLCTALAGSAVGNAIARHGEDPLHPPEEGRTGLGEYKDDGAEAFVEVPLPAASASGDSSIKFMPQPVANWLYQRVADVVTVFQSLLDGGGSFAGNGEYVLPASGGRESMPASGGEIVVWWGTELGARRNQSIIPWDYDADFAVFVTESVDFASLWRQAASLWRPLGVTCVEHSPGKYRICPAHPLAWSPWRELYQETKESHPGLARPKLIQLAAKLARTGQAAKRPHGCNCVDLEVYVVKPNKKIRIKATKPFELSPSDIFPVVEGILGPLRVPVPKTPAALDGEYGTGWPKEHIIKICQGHGCKTIDLGQPVAATSQPVAEIVRRQIWPDCPLQRCDHLLQPYFGASTRASSADQLWRKHG